MYSAAEKQNIYTFNTGSKLDIMST